MSVSQSTTAAFAQFLGHRGLARALICDPALILADEPTGSLDSATSTEIIDLFADLSRRLGMAIVSPTTAGWRSAATGESNYSMARSLTIGKAHEAQDALQRLHQR